MINLIQVLQIDKLNCRKYFVSCATNHGIERVQQLLTLGKILVK